MGKKFVSAVIVAAGNSTRMGGKISKQFQPLNGKPLISYTLRAFEDCGCIDEIVLVVKNGDEERMKSIVREYGITKCTASVCGGEQRQDSVMNGLRAVNEKAEYIAVHDGARPLVTPEIIEKTVLKAYECRACTAAVAVVDTLKRADESGKIINTVDRAGLWQIQTPQVFERQCYESCLSMAAEAGKSYTDDCRLAKTQDSRLCLCLLRRKTLR